MSWAGLTRASIKTDSPKAMDCRASGRYARLRRAMPGNDEEGLPAAIVAARAHLDDHGPRGSHHLRALHGRVLRRNVLELHALGRDHAGLRHHHGLVARRNAMRDALARRNHHGLVVGLILRRDDLLLIAGDAGLRRRRVAAATGG